MALSSLERVIPALMNEDETTGKKTLLLHLERYQYALNYLVPGTVADIACGVGYGSHLLAASCPESISRIIAVDIDQTSIDYARLNYSNPKIEFMVADAETFQSPVSLQNVVSLETIEHLPNPEKFINNISTQLVVGGRFITSVPVTPSMDANPYHLHDFTVNTFKQMFLKAGLKEIHSFIQVQPYRIFSLMGRKENRAKDLRKNIIGFYWQYPSKLLLRILSVFKDGFTNKYMVAVFEKQ
ncbi:MAG: class I SAM-dependent methyltransferase [Niastella sp.]|jgi:2-polyprenyl-3-methyl-5-hydroxy-6-metoxy-1,4-benzoquinol methylase|uniref:class I SAM-dependent methyltransferase n=1 Tax=Niastella sp. TaxID=1869183 RepID=UPI00389A7E02